MSVSPWAEEAAALARAASEKYRAALESPHGEAVQVEPMKPVLKAPGFRA
jgi:hypothetical protein